MKVEKQSTKLITPLVPTAPTLRHYKLGFIDEFVGAADVRVVLFFSANGTRHNTNNAVTRLEQSLKQTLTRLYPLAGRYVEETHTIDCNDQGAKFIYANANIKLEDLFLVFKGDNIKFIDDLIPSKIGAIHKYSDSLLATQVTTFECGGIAIGVSATHKIVDASTLCTIINEWASINREENETKLTGPGFNSSLLLPARGLNSIPVQPMSDETIHMFTRKKVSFSESVISNMKSKGHNNSTRRWSKVQLVAAIIWKTFMRVDRAKRDHQRESILIQAVNLRERMGSLTIPKNSCGNFWGLCTTDFYDTDEATEDMVDRLSDSVKQTISKFSKGRDGEEGQERVLNSLTSNMNKIYLFSNVVIVTSWCKFPFYEAEFGFGKPVWVAPGTIPASSMAYLMDDAQGDGLEAHVFLEVKDVPCFEEALNHVIMH
ncbi:hypothetical protein QVD17_15900 [Tagetes erecta]|uniref:Transferase, Chloramphenicol acetyltransferase-like domain protein n=1 Tax=Tagetes erecta TaxID=13708 RepID=A0AAD8P022_TARER|nr:hypothetical protein QVD17_15900 [Tagetes erecta]